jgi:hypothetical protein
MPGYMSGSKKARSTASIVNNKQVGVKAGLAPTRNASAATARAFQTSDAQLTATVPNTPAYRTVAAQVGFLRARGLVSVNPAGSGFVGRRYPIARMNFA